MSGNSSSISPGSSASQVSQPLPVALSYDAVGWGSIVSALQGAGVNAGSIARIVATGLDLHREYLATVSKLSADALIVSANARSVASVSSSVVSEAVPVPAVPVVKSAVSSVRSSGLSSVVSMASSAEVAENAVKQSFAGQPGYCYLWAVVRDRIPDAMAKLGASPDFLSLVSLDASWFESFEMLRALPVDEALPYIHVRNGGTGLTNFLSLCRSVAVPANCGPGSLAVAVAARFKPLTAYYVNSGSTFVGMDVSAGVSALGAGAVQERQVVPDLPGSRWWQFVRTLPTMLGISTQGPVSLGSSRQFVVDVRDVVFPEDPPRMTDLGVGHNGFYHMWLSSEIHDGMVDVGFVASPGRSAVWVLSDAYVRAVSRVVVDGKSYNLPGEGALCFLFHEKIVARVHVRDLASLGCYVYEGELVSE